MAVDINILRDRREQQIKRMRALLDAQEKEDRDLTEDESKEYDEAEKRVADLDKRIEREERMQTLEIVQRAAVEDDDDDGANPEQRGVEVGKDRRTLKPFAHFGEQMIAIHRYARSQGREVDERLFGRQVDTEGRAISGASETIAADGGFLVQKDFSDEILKKMHETGQVMSRVQEIPLSGNSNGLKINAIDETSRVDGSRWGGVRAYWIGEGGTLTGTKPTFRQIQLDLKKLTALYYATSEVLEDAMALGTLAQQAFTEELTFKCEDAIFRGNGGVQPLGFLNANCLISVAKESGQAASTVLFENITKMWSRCWARSRMNAVWFINQDVEPQLASLALNVGTGGAPAYMPAGGLSGQPFGTLYGRPVIPVEYCDTVGNQSDIVLADLSQYITIRKGGVRSDSSIHVKFENDEVTFRWILRTDGQPWWTSALTPFKGSNSYSPYIVLDAR